MKEIFKEVFKKIVFVVIIGICFIVLTSALAQFGVIPLTAYQKMKVLFSKYFLTSVLYISFIIFLFKILMAKGDKQIAEKTKSNSDKNSSNKDKIMKNSSYDKNIFIDDYDNKDPRRLMPK
jgi:uncharacterized membrane protein